MTREEFMDLSDWDLVNVIFRPNANEDDPEKGYWPVTRDNPDDRTVGELSHRQVFFDHARRRGIPEEEIEERFRLWFASYQGG